MITQKWVTLLIFLVLSLAAAGCEKRPAQPTTAAAEAITATKSLTLEEAAPPTRTPAPTALPAKTLTPVVRDPSFEDELDCSSFFCQVAWPGGLIRPISGENRDRIDLTYPYASTKGGSLDPHHGVEFPNAYGTPVRAAADGDVVFAGKDDLTLLGPYTGFYGNVVILRHPKFFRGRDLFSLYAHLSELGVEEGDFLSAGQVLGKVGASGAADGSHLHFEIRLDENNYDQTVNPVLWFMPAADQKGKQLAVLAGQILDSYGVPLSEFDFVLEKRVEGDSEVEKYYPVTYVGYGVNAHPLLDENFVLPDIPPGEYRLAFISGRFYEFEFTLNPGALGFIQIQLD